MKRIVEGRLVAARFSRWRRPPVVRLARLLLLAVLIGCSRTPTPPPPGLAPQKPSAHQRPAAPPPSRPHLAVAPRLVDVAGECGIDFTYFNDFVPERWFIPEVMGGGAAWLDYDLDGWIDLYLTNGCRMEQAREGDGEHRDRLYRNRGGAGFGDVSPAAGIIDDRYGQGVAVGDFDADGFPDLYLANHGPAVLLHNNGDGTFSDVTTTAGIGNDKWGTSVAFADLDHDGHLDIYACNFLDNTLDNNKACEYPQGRGYCGPGSYLGEQDQVYVSRGDGTFAEMSQALGFVEHDGRGKGLAVGIVDLNNDLVPEVYVGNDMTPNYLYVARQSAPPPGEEATGAGAVRYEEIATSAGCAVSDEGENEASMGIVCEDLDGDGLPDIFLCHFYQAKNTLYQNLGNLLFSDVSRRTRISATSLKNLGFGTVALDWDRDGRMDLFNATGHVLGPNVQPNHMQPQLLRQQENFTFVDVSDDVGQGYFAGKWLGRGVAGGDYDNDGDLDIAISHNDSPAALLRDDTAAPGRFLGLDLHTPSRLPPVGGRVEVVSGSIKRVRPLASGGSYLASHDPRLLFTLEEGDAAAAVTIFWPSGRVDHLSLAGNAYWRVTEGGAPVRLQWDQAETAAAVSAQTKSSQPQATIDHLPGKSSSHDRD